MKQTLQLKLSQHLTLTPQLQQSIRLLQLSTVELNAEVERMLQENPLLEKADGEDEGGTPEVAVAGAAPVTANERVTTIDEAPERERERERSDTYEGAERPDFED